MSKNIVSISRNEKLFLKTILNDGDIPDTEVARKTGMSKATANRVRKSLLQRRIIARFMPIIDLDKIGIALFTVVLFRWKGYKDEKKTQDILLALEKDQHIAFLGTGEGNGFTHCLFLGFTDLAEAHEYFNKFRMKYEDHLDEIISFFISSKDVRKQDYTEIIKYTINQIPDVGGREA